MFDKIMSMIKSSNGTLCMTGQRNITVDNFSIYLNFHTCLNRKGIYKTKEKTCY